MVGDAGLQYTMSEMTLAAELNLNIVILLWNNDALLQISDDMDNAGFTPFAVTQKNPDFNLLSQACGWQYQFAENTKTLDEQLNNAMHRACGPVLIQINEKQI